MRTLNLSLVVLVSVVTNGCATITSSDFQSVAVTTHNEQGNLVEKAKCTLKNDKGAWEAESPTFVDVRRSAEDLIVECRKEGHPDGLLKAISRAAAGMFGNIIFGGGIGAIIDHSRGTGYNYPDKLPVKMGQSLVIDRHEQNAPPGEKASATSSTAGSQ